MGEGAMLPTSSPPLPVQQRIEQRLGVTDPHYISISAGFSGCHVWKVDALERGSWALKYYPAYAVHERLQEIHRWQSAMQFELGDIVPRLVPWDAANSQTLWRQDEGGWELMDWIPGAPESELGCISAARLRSAMYGLGRLHACSMSWQSKAMVSVGWRQRLVRLQEDVDLSRLSTLEGRVMIARYPWLNEVLADCDRYRHVRIQQRQSLDCQSNALRLGCWILRDVWRAHMLFEGEVLRGWIDWSAAQCDWPIWDLVRFLGSVLRFEDIERWQDALNWYHEALKVGVFTSPTMGVGRSSAALQVDLHEVRFLSSVSILLAMEYWIAQLQLQGHAIDEEKVRSRLFELHRQWRKSI